MVRLSGNSGVNPARGGTPLATRVSGWDANSFVALEPPNGGFCRTRETDIEGPRSARRGSKVQGPKSKVEAKRDRTRNAALTPTLSHPKRTGEGERAGRDTHQRWDKLQERNESQLISARCKRLTTKAEWGLPGTGHFHGIGNPTSPSAMRSTTGHRTDCPHPAPSPRGLGEGEINASPASGGGVRR
jgi:hypothetical protein